MKRSKLLLLAVALLLVAAVRAEAATEVRMTGDALIYGNYFSGRNFTGWNNAYWNNDLGAVTPGHSKAEEKFEIWQRFRLQSDFIASESVKFRLGLLVEDTWGHGTFTAANPSSGYSNSNYNYAGNGYGRIAGGVEVYQAYLQFKWPGTDVQITAGLQPAALPQSSFFAGSVIFDEDVAGLVITSPIIPDTLSLVLAYVRTISSAQSFSDITYGNNMYPNEEGFLLALPVTVEGFKATPWAMYGQGGPAGRYLASGGWAEGLISAGLLGLSSHGRPGWKNNFITAMWAGSSFEVSALDPIKFYADVIWGQHGMNEYRKNVRNGWFIDLAVEYTGFSMVTPQGFGWWSTGEDGSTNNGSERMPHFFPGSGNGGLHNGNAIAWNAGNSFLFDGGQELVKGSNLGINPVGTWGFGVSLNKMSFMEKLSHILTFAYVHGNNSPTAIRDANLLLGGSNPVFCMGRDLTNEEWVIGINFDTKYMLYDNLALILETGWAHANHFRKSVWDVYNEGITHNQQDAWKVAFGLKYTF